MFTLASRHSPTIELLKIIQRRQRESHEHPRLHSFASHCSGILAAGAEWADVATLLSQGALEAVRDPPSLIHPAIGGRKLHGGARPRLISPICFPSSGRLWVVTELTLPPAHPVALATSLHLPCPHRPGEHRPGADRWGSLQVLALPPAWFPSGFFCDFGFF